MTVLVGGMRSLGISSDDRGLFSDGSSLSNEWFETLRHGRQVDSNRKQFL